MSISSKKKNLLRFRFHCSSFYIITIHHEKCNDLLAQLDSRSLLSVYISSSQIEHEGTSRTENCRIRFYAGRNFLAKRRARPMWLLRQSLSPLPTVHEPQRHKVNSVERTADRTMIHLATSVCICVCVGMGTFLLYFIIFLFVLFLWDTAAFIAAGGKNKLKVRLNTLLNRGRSLTEIFSLRRSWRKNSEAKGNPVSFTYFNVQQCQQTDRALRVSVARPA